MDRTLSIEIKDSLFDPDDSQENVAVYREGTSSESGLYQVFIYLDGPDLPFVDFVTYVLHPTFSPPVRVVTRSVSNPRCKTTIWTWGIFDVRAEITDKTGAVTTLPPHKLSYAQQINAPSTMFKAG